MKNILIHHNYKRETIKIKDRLIRLLNEEDINIVSKNPDLVVSIGGDGTMLNAIRKHFAEQVPFIGINTGSLGFLPTISSKNLNDFIDVIKNNMYTITKYPLLKVNVTTVKGEDLSCFAFNEVLIKQAEPRLMKATIAIDGQHFNDFTGDGLIVSTPVGSTGYAIWTNGAAIHPDVKCLQLVPMNPNDCAINHPVKTSIVLPERTIVGVKVKRPLYSAVVVGCDGVKVARHAAKSISVRIHDQPVQLLRCHPFNYFDLYSEKILLKKLDG